MNGLKYIRSEVIREKAEDLATQLRISKQTVTAWESGKKEIPHKRLKQLSELTGIPEQYFLLKELTEQEKLECKKYWLRI